MGGCCSKPPPSGVPIRVPPIKLMRGAIVSLAFRPDDERQTRNHSQRLMADHELVIRYQLHYLYRLQYEGVSSVRPLLVLL